MKLINWECLEEMDKLIGQGVKVDAIIADIPYWTTACKWDSVIDFDEMWERLNRLIKPNGAIVLFWSEPFSSALRMSNIKNYKYDWKYNKTKWSNPFLVKYQPHRTIEDIVVFCKWKTVYNPQMEFVGIKDNRKTFNIIESKETSIFWKWKTVRKKDNWYRYPNQVITINNADKTKSLHPTQKPVTLMEYLIKTYTLEWETVLDFTMWSWSTWCWCVNTNRDFIWIELDEWYFNIAKQRLKDMEVTNP